ncbi:MAG: 3-phosphoshikimate 1-carboxyvinyltransferase [Gammaproteobacteria bacterium]|nr:3-phosphoshikimate 1-carboxyvinyltransferase [Gammaproteobacteria bacterium]MCI0590398.1 3-phosphoshikimate 1-carboxyvinyltransferase [Gammaproteobacteria bacterium]
MDWPGSIAFQVAPSGPLHGRIRVPGDKSISHRSLILGALAEGVTEVRGFLEGEDTLATMAALSAMGVKFERQDAGQIVIHGVGLHGFSAPKGPLYLGNSGTSARLFAGVLAGQPFDSELTGDASLSRRPMQRVLEPLSRMGARLTLSERGTLPLHIRGQKGLLGVDYQMPVASAQVKSCVLLAGLYAKGWTCVTEPAVTRDHTERLLLRFGYPLTREERRICVEGGRRLAATEIDVPADISSAAFFMVGAAVVEGSDILLEEVGINPTRTAVIEVLREMDADITVHNQRTLSGEPVADIQVRARPLHGIPIAASQVSRAIDEFPAIFIAAACARGQTVVRGAAELRVKESDRIEAMATGLKALGADAEPTEDGIIINGGHLHGGSVDSCGDHRIAMAFAIAGMAASAPIRVQNCASVETSFPKFAELARRAGLDIVITGTGRG